MMKQYYLPCPSALDFYATGIGENNEHTVNLLRNIAAIWRNCEKKKLKTPIIELVRSNGRARLYWYKAETVDELSNIRDGYMIENLVKRFKLQEHE